jgi:hypothetical protein
MRETAGPEQVVTSAGGATAVCGASRVPSGLPGYAATTAPGQLLAGGERLPSFAGEQARRGLGLVAVLAGNRS